LVEFINDLTSIIIAIFVGIGAVTALLTFLERKNFLVFSYFTRDPYKILDLRLAGGDIDGEKYKKLKKILDENRN